MPPQPSASRALSAILPQIEAGAAYEAHQKARTFASRYVKANQHSVAAEVLLESARALLKAGQAGSGTDLSLYLIEVWELSGVAVDDDHRAELMQLLALVGPEGFWRKQILDRALQWTSKVGESPAGDAQLLHYIGEQLYKEGSYAEAEPYLLTAGKRDSGRVLGTMFSTWASSSPSTPFGHFALRGVLPYLESGNILAARAFVASLRPLKAQSVPVGDSGDEVWAVPGTNDLPLLFAQLAILLCQRGRPARDSWTRLYGSLQSRGGLMSHPEVRKSIQQLSAIYFGIVAQRPAANPFGDLLGSLLGGGGQGQGAGAGRAAPRLGGGRVTPGTPGLD